MRVRFWGTRGSIAKAGPATVRYGGNTSCVEARSRAGTLLILDCGTGAHGLAVLAAAEGLTIDLMPAARPAAAHRQIPGAAEASVPPELLTQSVLVAVDDPDLRGGLAEAVCANRLTLLEAADGDELLATMRSAPPSVLLLGRRLGDRDGLEVCRDLRKSAAGSARALPIVAVAANEAEADRAAGAEAGVTDWLVAPFSTLYARTRIRAWALRQACRWLRAPLPPDEPERLRALRAAGILDTPPEERFDRITRLARRVFDVPVAFVSLVDADRQWFKSRQGLDVQETPRELSFCAHAIHDDRAFIVSDALMDPRFADHPSVSGEMRVRFYAGRPVRIAGRRVGALCVVDRRPRELRDDDLRMLDDLATLVEKELATRAVD